MEDLRKKLLDNTLSKIKAVANNIVTKTTNYFNPESNGGNNFWGSKPMQAYGNSNAAQFIQGFGEGASKWITPYAKLVGEGAYQIGRVGTDPSFRKLVFKGANSLTPQEIENVNKMPSTMFLKPEQVKDPYTTMKTGVAATTKADLAVAGLASPAIALSTAGISGLLAYTMSKLTGSKTTTKDVGEAMGYSPVYAGINKITAIPQASVTSAIIGKGQPLVTRMLTRGTIDAAANFLTDEIFTPLTEMRRPTAQERVISVGTGFVGGAGTEGAEQIIKNTRVNVNKLLDKWFPGQDTQRKRDIFGQFAKEEMARNLGIEKEPTYMSDGVKPVRDLNVTEGGDINNLQTGQTIKFDKRTGKQFQAAGTLTEAQKMELRKALYLPEDGNYKPPIGLTVKPISQAEHEKFYGKSGEGVNIKSLDNKGKKEWKALFRSGKAVEQDGKYYLRGEAPDVNPKSVEDWTSSLEAPKANPMDEVKAAIDSGDKEAAKALYDTIEGAKPAFDDVVSEIENYQKGEMKDAMEGIKGKYGGYNDVVVKFRKFLRIAGEKTSKQTGELYREHIPESVFGVSSDEIASTLGKSENEFMSEITADLKIAESGKATPQVMARIKTNVDKIRNFYKKLDPNVFEVHKDELGRPNGVSVIQNMEGVGKIAKSRIKALELTAKNDYKEWQSQVVKQEGLVTSNDLVKNITKTIGENTKSSTADITGLKDIGEVSAGWRDVYRNFKAVFGKRYPEAKALILDPFDKSKGNFIDTQNKWIANLDSYIVKGLGIKKGSTKSRLVQEFGEGQITESELNLMTSTKDAQDIKAADKWFRQSYDQLLTEVNKARAVIYPNNPSKQIPRRADYYRHFRELAEGFQGLLNIFDTPAGISSSLSGVSEFAKPKSKWLSIAQKRIGIKTQHDAVGGFLDYIKAASYAKTIDPQIDKFRSLADELANATAEGDNAGKLNNFIEYLRDFSNDLSGKTNPMDRTLQKWIPGGRKTFRVMNWLNSRVKANQILGNLSSSVAQIFNVPQGIASAGPINAAKGLGRTFADMFRKGGPMNKSDFIKERYFNSYDKFDEGILQNTKKFAAWMTGALDEVGTKYIWNSHYEKALAGGIENPGKFADDMTREMVAGRGVGEVPLAQKSKVTQMIAPFQLEVANLWWVMKDMVDQKQFGKLATLFVMNYVFNKGAEKVRGSGVVMDPIQAMLDAFKTYQEEPDKKMGVLKAGGRIAGEALSNIPYGQTAAAVYPEYGFNAWGNQFPTRKALFGKEDPTRFGGGLLVSKGLQDPLYKVLPPFGGAQIEKTVNGVKTYMKGYSEDKSGNVQFPVEKNIPNAIKSAAFGQYSIPEAVKYLNSGGKPLGEKQTALFKQQGTAEDKLSIYTKVLTSRATGKIEDAARAKVEELGQTQETENKVFYWDDSSQEVKSVQKNRQIRLKPLTGSKELDDKIVAQYKSDLNAKENDIVKLWELGKIPQDEAIKQLQMIKKLKTKLAKPKKLKAIKYTVPKSMKLTIPKSNIPKSRLAKVIKSQKSGKAKFSVPKIWTSK